MFPKQWPVEPVTILFCYGVLLNAPIMQQFVYQAVSDMKGFYNTQVEKTGCDYGLEENNTIYNNSDQDQLRREVQSMSSMIQLLITMTSNIPGIIVALILGSWTDRIGRRPILCLPPIGHSIESIIVLLVMYLKWPIYVLFVGSLITGLCGTLPTFMTGILAYITDITDEESRPLRMAILEAAVLVGGCVSFATSGIWIKYQGFIPPYWLVCVTGFVSVMYIVFLLPESRVQPENLEHKPNCLLDLKRTFGVFTIKRKKGRFFLIALVICSTIQNFCVLGISGVLILFFLDKPFCMSPVVVGILMAFRMFIIAFGAIIGIRVLGKWISLPVVAMISIVCMMATSVFTAISTNYKMLFAAPIVGLFQGGVGPILKSLMSQTVDKNQKGALFAAVVTIENVGSIAAAMLFNSLYAWSQRHLQFSGFVFLVSAGLLIIPLILLVYIKIKLDKYGPDETPSETPFMPEKNSKDIEVVSSL